MKKFNCNILTKTNGGEGTQRKRKLRNSGNSGKGTQRNEKPRRRRRKRKKNNILREVRENTASMKEK